MGGGWWWVVGGGVWWVVGGLSLKKNKNDKKIRNIGMCKNPGKTAYSKKIKRLKKNKKTQKK